MKSVIYGSFGGQLFGLLILAIPIACIVRTVIFEEIFKEPRDWCHCRSQTCNRLLQRKFFYLFTCEYCFSHWVTLATVIVTGFHLLLDDWRGGVIAFFSLVFVANIYLNLYGRIRLEIQKDKAEIKTLEQTIARTTANISDDAGHPPIDGSIDRPAGLPVGLPDGPPAEAKVA